MNGKACLCSTILFRLPFYWVLQFFSDFLGASWKRITEVVSGKKIQSKLPSLQITKQAVAGNLKCASCLLIYKDHIVQPSYSMFTASSASAHYKQKRQRDSKVLSPTNTTSMRGCTCAQRWPCTEHSGGIEAHAASFRQYQSGEKQYYRLFPCGRGWLILSSRVSMSYAAQPLCMQKSILDVL